MKIKVLEKTPGCLPQEIKVGDWYDLCTAEEITLKAPEYIKAKDTKNKNIVFDSKLVPLGVCIQVPSGYESILAPRSSSFKKYGILQTNSIGIIDNSYSSDRDEWKLPVLATKAITIPKGTRIAQFRIQLSQKATVWQKLKGLFNSKPKFIRVETLNNKERGGFGSTGK